MTNYISFEPGHEVYTNYNMIIGANSPRPIACVSTKNDDGTDNLAPFSFNMVASINPLVVCFSPILPSNGVPKDTLRNVKTSKEFVYNVVNRELAEKINRTSANLPYGQDEFNHAGLSKLDSDLVSPKRVAESPIQLECKVVELRSFGDSPLAGSVVFGEVVKIHVNSEVLDVDSGNIKSDLLDLVGRMNNVTSGSEKHCLWVTSRDTFVMDDHRGNSGEYK